MTETIRIRLDADTKHALDILTSDGSSRSAAVRQAVLEAAAQERAAEMRRAVLQTDLGEFDGVNIAGELARFRENER
jgi:Arc/MetJ-type ribon-helix-helix transcriptional regulator